MKHCNKCKIDVNTNKNYCPLCYNELEGQDCENLVYKIKDTNKKHIKHRNLIQRIFFFISLCIVIINIFINFSVNPTVIWSAIVATSILYVWILVRHTILSRRSIFEKILFQVIGLLLMLYVTYIISGGGNWFWNYVQPSIAITTTLVGFVLLLCFKSDHLCSFFFTFVLFLITSVIFFVTKLDTFQLLNQICAIINGLIIISILIFNFKGLKRAIVKNFNL